MKRTGKFYRKNEAQVMESLGLRPTKNSGAGWVEKEDGENDYIMCQLKSTDAQSIRVNLSDIQVLEVHAAVSHKLPIFAIQFLATGDIWVMAKPADFCSVAEYMQVGKTDASTCGNILNIDNVPDTPQARKNKISSTKGARDNFYNNLYGGAGKEKCKKK